MQRFQMQTAANRSDFATLLESTARRVCCPARRGYSCLPLTRPGRAQQSTGQRPRDSESEIGSLVVGLNAASSLSTSSVIRLVPGRTARSTIRLRVGKSGVDSSCVSRLLALLDFTVRVEAATGYRPRNRSPRKTQLRALRRSVERARRFLSCRQNRLAPLPARVRLRTALAAACWTGAC